MFFDTISKVYNNLADDISKYLFMRRVEYSITGNDKCIFEIDCKNRNLSADIEHFYEDIEIMKDKKVVAFGAGNIGITIAKTFPNLFVGFIDNNKKWDIGPLTKLPCYSPDDFFANYEKDDYYFFVTVSNKNIVQEIVKQLCNLGIFLDHIYCLPISDWRNNCSQYFDLFAPHKNEVFVDCGCYDGSTAFRFAGWCGSLSYDKIICFEPDPTLYCNLNEILDNLGRCELYRYGVSDKKATVNFLANAREDAKIVSKTDDKNVVAISTVSLDEFLSEQRITFIKMDIEGAEYDAIVGASNIIKKQKPRLAICLYHSKENIVTIPKLLLDLRPDYKLYIRHYSLLANETILYAE